MFLQIKQKNFVSWLVSMEDCDAPAEDLVLALESCYFYAFIVIILHVLPASVKVRPGDPANSKPYK